MTADVKFSSKRFMLTLTLCACSVILLLNDDSQKVQPFPLRLAAVAAGLGASLLFFIPSVLIKKRYDSDTLTLLSRRSKPVRCFAAVIYCLYFGSTALYFLLPYTDMFCKKYYPETTPPFVAFLLLVCCIYAARKGVNVITRFGIFLFVMAMITNALLFGGSISSLDFQNGSSGSGGSLIFFGNDIIYFLTPCFISAVFACLAAETHDFRLRHPVTALALTGVKYALVLFFITFALGKYAFRQEYRTFVLSRAAHFGAFAGIESFYMALATMSVFMIISLLLCCMGRSCGREDSLAALTVFAVLFFLLYLFSLQNSILRELLTQPVILILFTFLTAVVIPTACLISERRRNV